MNTSINLKNRIMFRVYLEYTKNIFWGNLDYFMFGIFVVFSFIFVSIQDVLNNIPKDNLFSIFNFFMVAIRNTSLIIQILIAGFFVRTIIASIKLANKNINTGWLATKFRY